jgi:hypothetical protein
MLRVYAGHNILLHIEPCDASLGRGLSPFLRFKVNPFIPDNVTTPQMITGVNKKV